MSKKNTHLPNGHGEKNESRASHVQKSPIFCAKEPYISLYLYLPNGHGEKNESRASQGRKSHAMLQPRNTCRRATRRRATSQVPTTLHEPMCCNACCSGCCSVCCRCHDEILVDEQRIGRQRRKTRPHISNLCVAVCVAAFVADATHCDTWQHTTTHGNTLQHTAAHCKILQHTATHCNILQHTATHCNTVQHTATHCITLQHTATHCNTLQHTATRCNTMQHNATHCSTLQHNAAHCSTLQHTAAHCNTLQHTATHNNTLHTPPYRRPPCSASVATLAPVCCSVCCGVCCSVRCGVCVNSLILIMGFNAYMYGERWGAGVEYHFQKNS